METLKKTTPIIIAFIVVIIFAIWTSYIFKQMGCTEVKIKQVNGPGIKTIYDNLNHWDVLPFKVGDTINEFDLCRGCIPIDTKNFIVIEIKYKK